MFEKDSSNQVDDESKDGRSRALLTQTDRAYLSGKKEIDDEQGKRNVRYRIRTRIKNGLKDLDFLYGRLRDEDHRKIFRDLFDEEKNPVEQGCAVIFLGVDHVYTSLDEFERFLERSIHKAVVEKRDEDTVATVRVNVTIAEKSADLDEIQRRLVNNEATFRDLEYLMESDEIGPALRRIADKDEIIIRSHFDDKEDSESFSFNELVTLGLSGVRERLEE
jgi:hypothetical protein